LIFIDNSSKRSCNIVNKGVMMASISSLPEAEVPLDDLILDDSNPRFAQLYTGKSQDDIIMYLLNEEYAKEIAKIIAEKGSFRQDKKLWVTKLKKGKFLVRDGNRRCAAVKALQNPAKFGLPQHQIPFSVLPVIIYDNEALLKEYIKDEHAASSKRNWSSLAKALEMYNLAQSNAGKTAMAKIDTDIRRFMQIANFYYGCIQIKSITSNLQELLRTAGPKGRNLIIFERMFGIRNKCGYDFGKADSNFELKLSDKKNLQPI
jgi:hypothetical protein